jgi:hypothetical protein
MSNFAHGGDDVLTAGGVQNTFYFYGDADGSMSGPAHGGNDMTTTTLFSATLAAICWILLAAAVTR